MGAVPILEHGFVLETGIYGAHLTLGVRGFHWQTTHGGSVTHANRPPFVSGGAQGAVRTPSTARRKVLDFARCERHWQGVNVKSELRKQLRKARREHVAGQPPAIRSLLFNRPPEPLLEMLPQDAVIGLYHATANEAPTAAYAKFFLERGHTLALPRFPSLNSEMSFATFTDPFTESDLVEGPFHLMQPKARARNVIPDVVFLPLVGFSAQGHRLGQGGGHYDRWLEAHPGRTKVGLAWDVQLVGNMPLDPHDQQLDAVVTPTRMYGPFA
jgi:5-formyltetrahydrofolate cyclo-ligase